MKEYQKIIFKVNFTTGLNGVGISDKFNPGRGRDIINAIKEQLELPFLDPEKINIKNVCSYTNGSVEVSLPFEVADRIPWFQSQSTLDVYLPSGWAGQYFHLHTDIQEKVCGSWDFFEKLKFSKMNLTERISSVFAEFRLDKKAIVDAWLEADYPKYWGITKERHDQLLAQEKIARAESARKNKLAEEKKDKKKREEHQLRMQDIGKDLQTLTRRFNDMIQR